MSEPSGLPDQLQSSGFPVLADGTSAARDTKGYPIRRALVGLVGIPLFALLAALAYDTYRQSEQDIANATRIAVTAAETAASQTEQFLARAEYILIELSHRAKVQALDPADCDPLLADLKLIESAYANVLTLDLQGRVVCSASGIAPGQAAGPDPKYYFAEIVRTHKFTVGKPAKGFITGRWVSTLGYPIQNRDGQFMGVVALSVNLATYRPLVVQQTLPPRALVTVINSEGTLIARSQDSAQLIGSVAKSDLITRALEQRRGTARGRGFQDIDRLVAFTPIARSDWTALVSFEAAEVLAPARRLALERLSLAIAVVLAIAALTFRVSRRISEPIESIAGVIAAVKTGARQSRASAAGPMEIRQIAVELNAMLDARVQAEAAVRENEQKLRLFIRYAPSAIAMFDRDMRYIAFSHRWLADYDLARQDLAGRSHYEVFPDLPERWKEIHRRCLAGATERCDEDPFPRADGSVDWVRWEVHPWRTSEGDIGGIVIFSEVMTERKRADMALRASEMQTKRILQAADVGLWDWDLITQEVYLSPEWKHQLGYEDHELPNRIEEWQERIHPADLEPTLAALREFREGHHLNYGVDFRMRHKDGSWRWVFARADIVRNAAGEPVRMMGSHTDVTELHKAKDTIREERDRQSTIIDASMDAIIALDASERVLIFSAAAERMFRLPAAEAIGQNLDRFIPARFRGNHHAHIRQFGETGVTARKIGQFARLTALRQDGSEFPIEASISHALSGGGHLFTVTIRDITERERTEAVRASLEAQLRESQKMEAIGTLAGGIAHDFNNIISIILGNTHRARENAGASPRALESLEEIHKAGMRASDLVRQILSFSRRQPTDRKSIALEPTIAESARLMSTLFPAGVSVEFQCAAAVPRVLADATQIQQVVINLATNAMHAMHGRPGHISIRLDTVTIDTALTQTHSDLRTLIAGHPGPTVRLAVTDDGQGMDAATLERIFEPFFTTKPAGEGTGLGLSVVHGIVQTHEGAIVVDSVPGKGTNVAIYLPAAQAQTGASELDQNAGTVTATPDASGGQHILYLDDEDALVFLVKYFLEQEGCRVSGFTNQREALAALRANPAAFDLIVTDYNMPGMSGLDVAREVHAIRADLPVALTSGVLDDELKARAGAAGVRELIFKATDMKQFCAHLQRLAQTAHAKANSS